MRKIAFILFCVSNILVSAQQTPTLDNYLANPYLMNPASVGVNGNNAYLDLRSQWVGFVGAPQTQVLTLDGSFKKDKFGLGMTIINDQVNVIGTTGAYLTYAYRAYFSKDHRISLGVSGGVEQNRIIYDRIIAEDPTEAQIFLSNQNAAGFDANAGIDYRIKKFTLSLAAQHLIPSSFRYENNFASQQLTFTNIRHFYALASHDFLLKGNKWRIQPSIMARGVQGMPFRLEGTLLGEYKEKVSLLFRYAHNISYGAGFGLRINNNLSLNYVYAYSSQDLSNISSGSHELMVGYKFGKSGNQGTSLDEDELKKLQQNDAELFEKIGYLESENEDLKKELAKQKEELKKQVFGLKQLKEELEKEKLEREEMIKNSQVILSESNGTSSNVTSEEATSNNGASQSKENNTSGAKNQVELVDANYYVIIGASRKIENAKKFQNVVSREYNQTTKVVRNSRDSWYLVYTLSTKDKDEALKELKKVRKMDSKNVFVGKPWVYSSK